MSLIPYALARSFLFKMDPEEAHDLTIEGLAMRAAMWPIYAEAIETVLGARVNEEDRAALARLLAPLAEPLAT